MLSSSFTPITNATTNSTTNTTIVNLSILLLNGISNDEIQNIIKNTFPNTMYLEVLGPNWDASYETLFFGSLKEFSSFKEAFLLSANPEMAMDALVKNVNYHQSSLESEIPFKLLVIDPSTTATIAMTLSEMTTPTPAPTPAPEPAPAPAPETLIIPPLIASFYDSIYILSNVMVTSSFLELGTVGELKLSLLVPDCPIGRAAIKYLKPVISSSGREALIGEHLDNPTLSLIYKEKVEKICSSAGIMLNPSPADILRERFIRGSR